MFQLSDEERELYDDAGQAYCSRCGATQSDAWIVVEVTVGLSWDDIPRMAPVGSTECPSDAFCSWICAADNMERLAQLERDDAKAAAG